MPQGIQVWDANGVVTLDTNDPTMKILNVVDMGTNSSGSTSHWALAHVGSGTARLWYVVIPNSNTESVLHLAPTVSLSGTTLSWTTQGSPANYLLVFGLY